MAFEFEALVGHLYVVGGRSISTTPPGTLVEVAPKRAARGREADTFFVMVIPSGETIAPAAFYEQMAELSAERYFSSTGSVTAALRVVFTTLNDNLYQHNSNDPKHYEAGLLCAVLRGGDLYLAKVGPGVALLYHEETAQPFPADFDNDEALYTPPLGVQTQPDVKMARYTIGENSRLLLADAALADTDMEALQAAVSAADIAAVMGAVRPLVGAQITLMVVEFVPPEVPVPVPTREGESTAILSKPPTPSTGDGASASAATVTPGRRRSTAGTGLEIPVQDALGKAAGGMARGLEVTNRALNVVLPPPNEGKPRIPGSVVTAIAVLVPLLVVVAVIGLWVGGAGESEFELCVGRAQEGVALARGLPSSDVTGTIAAWNAVMAIVNECNTIRAGDVTLAGFTVEGQTIIDRLLNVERRVATPIAAFPNATLTRAVLQGEDLYVLDNGNDLVYRVTLSSDGRSVVQGTQQAIPSMRRSATVNEFTVGDVLDIAWAEESAGLSQGNVLLALDRNGVLVECPPRFVVSCEAQRLLATETWVNPVAITLWQGRLYILDPGANQIWRYEPGGGAFTNAPTEYFVGDGRPDIRSAVDFGIDGSGSIYLMLSEGVLTKFTSGERQGFAFASFPDGQEITSANAMFLNTNPIAQDIYIVSQAARTIYQTTLAGTFISSFRAQDEALFTSLADVTVDASQQVVYALSGNSVLAFERAREP
jgi:hypothetical protein